MKTHKDLFEWNDYADDTCRTQPLQRIAARVYPFPDQEIEREARVRTMAELKLGSLFDGIAGFPYSASKFNIKSAWASEIEPWPIKVTEKHFPDMVHLGDITKINGAEIEPVDIITFGSPCPDLSVAGKRAGLEGERSGLFGEAVRIIREMRESTNGVYPRFAVWENVPGAYSSNKGQDFRAVLEEIGEAAIPMPESGKWATAGMVRTETADIAWRILDAQYWGVPQRRRRIFLVADFGGQCAGEILFKREGLSGHFAESGKKGEEVAGAIGGGTDSPMCIRMREGCAGGGKGPLISEGKSLTLGCSNDQTLVTNRINATPGGINGAVSSKWAKGTGGPAGDECYNLVVEPQLYDMTHADDVIRPVAEGLAPTLNSRMGTGGNQVPVMINRYAVRRLTPLECVRLQGFPDYWLDIEGMSDTAKYRAIGNSLAIPCVDYVMEGIAEALKKGGVF